jgi:putative oxidoreductase
LRLGESTCEVSLQRLFSTFADGWPGAGLLLQRLVTGAALLYFVFERSKEAWPFAAMVPQMLGVGAGILLLVGLWTPVVGAVVAVTELWIIFSGNGDPWMAILTATLGGSLAMIGPGAWSVDARLFGRRHIETSRPR